jgi:hypothetical protein
MKELLVEQVKHQVSLHQAVVVAERRVALESRAAQAAQA